MSAIDDARYMDLAVALARAQQGRTAPNPAVGCVLVRDGRIIATGATQDGGRPHAERVALDAAGAEAAGATAYVTLEPCAHHGQTPPCADGLVQAGIERAVIACGDRFEQVSGRGLAILAAAGMTVETGLRETDATSLYAGFFSRLASGLPQIMPDARARGYDGELTARSLDEAKVQIRTFAEAGMNRIRVAPDHPLADCEWPTVMDG
ncbi:bifunctional diaminohydroxyphosphoribosylaminopyrimidine deaminase/5-amino-6-(5-phosphoribosylamino)uracil reductase RibD [Maricaulis maris]|jgi:diaminohydroxyphosphoribosylaminopyrimidine deaminase/5-amino-6-(5-phosphoribosylamino)uracil reductase|uniref:bifunctional diaminohydroxyphosphoribosylaminopyrimidine deaminase/5-amino-6-(5-phosphoribosylamino)uracil reductase RibD n=1 Tax=Maricaulis maris TaxID=74318 RepID=UPI0026F0194C|nr:bifunctional diaminohydroxyphosphoribosylaminopyrimidine deaminase/5-amino-6-(5-phosphoribosylamino)uracil reductase RibD [Maricaulis maris]